MAETREFKTEVKQMLDLVIHSLYSNKELLIGHQPLHRFLSLSYERSRSRKGIYKHCLQLC